MSSFHLRFVGAGEQAGTANECGVCGEVTNGRVLRCQQAGFTLDSNRCDLHRNRDHPQWVEVEEARRKRMAFDHTQILALAVARLRSKVEYTSLPAFLLTEPFTLPQLQQTYEVVLGREVDKSAFRKRMLDAAFLEEVGVVDGVFGRAATGYRIRDRERAVTFPRMFKSGE